MVILNVCILFSKPLTINTFKILNINLKINNKSYIYFEERILAQQENIDQR